jgi:septal ring factor EnvC (AmiA/AmiB activator)
MMSAQRKYRCRKCGVEVLAGPYIAPELCSACQLAANAKRPESTSEITPEMIYRVAELHRTIKEQAAEIELLKAEIERLTELNKEAEEQLCAIAKEFCGDARNCEQHPKTLAGFVVQEVGKVRAEIERLRALLEGYEAMEKYMKHEAMK